MKDFMMLFIGADYETLGLSPEETQKRMSQWFAWSTKMGEAGYLRGGHALHAGGKRVTGKDRIVSDGPFAESKEWIGGYYIVNAKDHDAVVEIAQDFPDYDLGGAVEIREVIVFDNE